MLNYLKEKQDKFAPVGDLSDYLLNDQIKTLGTGTQNIHKMNVIQKNLEITLMAIFNHAFAPKRFQKILVKKVIVGKLYTPPKPQKMPKISKVQTVEVEEDLDSDVDDEEEEEILQETLGAIDLEHSPTSKRKAVSSAGGSGSGSGSGSGNSGKMDIDRNESMKHVPKKQYSVGKLIAIVIHRK